MKMNFISTCLHSNHAIQSNRWRRRRRRIRKQSTKIKRKMNTAYPTQHTLTRTLTYTRSLSPKWDTRKANCEEFYLQNGSDKTARIHKSSHNFFARCERVERLNGRINKQASMQSKVQRQCHRMQCNNTNSLYEHRIMSLLHFCITLIGTIPERALPPSISLWTSVASDFFRFLFSAVALLCIFSNSTETFYSHVHVIFLSYENCFYFVVLVATIVVRVTIFPIQLHYINFRE